MTERGGRSKTTITKWLTLTEWKNKGGLWKCQTSKRRRCRTNVTTQTYVMSRYNARIAALVRDEFREWRETMEKCLKGVYGEEAGRKEAEAMMIVIAGTFICNYNNALTGEINGNILGLLGNLSKS